MHMYIRNNNDSNQILQLYRASQIHSISVILLGSIISDIMADVEALFTKAQKSSIILQYGKLGSATKVHRWFRKQYPNIPNHRIP